MKLHANAPLDPKGRAVMVRRVLGEGEAIVALRRRLTGPEIAETLEMVTRPSRRC